MPAQRSIDEALPARHPLDRAAPATIIIEQAGDLVGERFHYPFPRSWRSDLTALNPTPDVGRPKLLPHPEPALLARI